jgi:hypothetical protein
LFFGQELEILRKKQVIIEFTGRTCCDLQVTLEFGIPPFPTTLRDVGADGRS